MDERLLCKMINNVKCYRQVLGRGLELRLALICLVSEPGGRGTYLTTGLLMRDNSLMNVGLQ
jgi:hypothetical protein